jgi:hypothetical protein
MDTSIALPDGGSRGRETRNGGPMCAPVAGTPASLSFTREMDSPCGPAVPAGIVTLGPLGPRLRRPPSGPRWPPTISPLPVAMTGTLGGAGPFPLLFSTPREQLANTRSASTVIGSHLRLCTIILMCSSSHVFGSQEGLCQALYYNVWPT